MLGARGIKWRGRKKKVKSGETEEDMIYGANQFPVGRYSILGKLYRSLGVCNSSHVLPRKCVEIGLVNLASAGDFGHRRCCTFYWFDVRHC